MDPALEKRLEAIERKVDRLLNALAPAAPAQPRKRGEPSELQERLEGERLAEILRTEGREAFKAANKARNEQVRARRR